MTIAKLFETIAITRLRQNSEPITADRTRFRMRDGKGDVILPTADWNALGDRVRDKVRPSARRLLWALVATIPFGIFLCAVIAAVPGLAAALDMVDLFAPGLSVLLITSGLPLYAMARHMLVVQRAVDDVHRSLAAYPRVEASEPAPRKQALQAFEIAALILVGPRLLIQAYGSLNPDAFRNTPWTGAHLDASGVAGLVVLAALALLRWRSGAPARRWHGGTEAKVGARRVDPLPRAHRQ